MIMKENRKVPFRDTAIRVLRNHDGMLYISADDVCGILKREEMLKKGDIARICPSAIRMPLRKGGHELWTFRPSDMRRLLQSVRKESILPRDLFDDLEAGATGCSSWRPATCTRNGRRTPSVTSRRISR